MNTMDTTEGPHIRISHESVDKLIVESLMYHISYVCKASNDIYETPVNKIHDLSAMLKTLEYYAGKSNFLELTKDISVKLKPIGKGGT
jgi:hypothetical protein